MAIKLSIFQFNYDTCGQATPLTPTSCSILPPPPLLPFLNQQTTYLRHAHPPVFLMNDERDRIHVINAQILCGKSCGMQLCSVSVILNMLYHIQLAVIVIVVGVQQYYYCISA